MRKLSDWLLPAAIFVFGLWLVSPIFNEGLPPGYDDPVYVVRSWFIQNRMRSGLSFDWCPYWYAGFPTLTFYPFIIEVFTVLISSISGISVLWAFKIVVALVTVMPAITLFLLARRWFGGKAAFVSSIFLLMMTRYTSFVEVVGLRVFTFGFALLPLQLLLFEGAVKIGGKRHIIICGLLLGVLIAFHFLSAYSSILIMGMYVVVYSLRRRNLRDLLKIVKTTLFVFLIGLGVAAFWIIPYLAEIDYSWVLRRVFQPPKHPTQIISEFPDYYGIIPTLCAVFGVFFVISRRRKPEPILLVLWFLAFLLISFGPYGLVWYILPLRSGLEYLRFENYLTQPLAVLAGLFVSEVISASAKIPIKLGHKKHRNMIISILVTAAILSFSNMAAPMSLEDIRGDFNTQKISDYQEFMDALEWLRAKEMEGRVLIHINMCDSGPKSYDLRQSTIAYLPFFTDKPLFYGHMHAESSLLSNYTIWLAHDTPLDPEMLYNMLRVGNVEYVMLGRESSPALFETLNSSEHFRDEEDFPGDQTISFFRLDYNPSLVEVPDSVVLAIAKDDSLCGKLFDAVIRREGGFRPIIVRGESEYIDDYSLPELRRFDAVIYYNSTYHDREKASTLLRDLEEAGVTTINYTNQVEQIISLPRKERSSRVSYQIRGDEVIINVSNTEPNTPILVKFSYFPRWEARYGGERMKIYKVSPEFMLVFLGETRDEAVKFDFVWRRENYIGALASITTLGLCVMLSLCKRFGKILEGSVSGSPIRLKEENG